MFVVSVHILHLKSGLVLHYFDCSSDYIDYFENCSRISSYSAQRHRQVRQGTTAISRPLAPISVEISPSANTIGRVVKKIRIHSFSPPSTRYNIHYDPSIVLLKLVNIGHIYSNILIAATDSTLYNELVTKRIKERMIL